MSTVNKITVTKNSSSNTYGLKDIDALRSAALTNVENEYVATKAYVVNDFLYRDDIFYKVIAPIPRGGTFVINQNIKATKLTDELAILNPTVIANPTGEVTGELEKLQVGNIVYGVSSGGSATLEGLEDTVIEEPTAAQPLTYDEENEVQINGGVIPIENGGTGNTTGYIKTGQKEGSTIGDNATIEGIDNVASGTAAHAEGQGTSAIGSKSHTEGANTKANNVEAHAEGTQTTAEGQGSHAEGGYTYAKGLYSHSEGNDTTAFGQYTHAEGRGSYAIADQSHAEGYFTSSQGYYSHSEGMNTSAVGSQSHAEGNQSTALGDQAHSEGYKTYAGKDYSHAEGSQTCAPGLSAHSENYYTKALGDYSHAEGNYTTAGGEASHAEGSYTYAAGYAHAEGSGKAYGSYSHAEGNYTNTASGATGAHAEGTATCAKGSYSHAEGAYTTTIGEASHTQGQNTTATGNRSSAAGSHTAAGYNDQFVIGYYNDNKSTSIFEVGNGTYETTSNALELDASGNLVVSGSITDGDGNVLGPGGTTVIANPSETASDNLLKLQIGDTIYGVSGGTEIAYGTANPTEATGGDGTLYLQMNPFTGAYKYLKFDITARKGGENSITQFSQLGFLDSQNQLIAWPAGVTWSTNVAVSGNDPIGQGQKLCAIGGLPTVTFTFPDNAKLDLSTAVNYRWYTANDAPDRDPVTWSLSVSDDGITQTLIDARTNETITDTRDTVAFTSNGYNNLPAGTSIKNVYYNNNSNQIKDAFGGSVSSLADLTDTTIISPADGQILKYDGTNSKQINANESNSGLSVDIITDNIESASTASKAYAIGDFLYKNDELYKAKTAIAQGDTFVVDTNIEETNITDEINTLKTNFQDGVDAVYDACVSKGSTPSSHALADVVDAIDNISGGNLGTKNITINGTYDASSDNLDGYSSVTVNVSSGGSTFAFVEFTYNAGSTVVATDGTSTLTSDTSGDFIFAIPNSGTWTFTSGTSSVSMLINTYGSRLNGRFSLLPYSVLANILAEAVVDNYTAGSTSWDAFTIGGNAAITTDADRTVLNMPQDAYAKYDLSSSNVEITAYIVCKEVNGDQYGRIVEIPYDRSDRNCPMFIGMNRSDVFYSTQGGSNERSTGVNPSTAYHAYAISINITTKEVHYCIDGNTCTTMPFNNSGSSVQFTEEHTLASDSGMDANVLFAAVVDGCESDSIMQNNCSALLTYFNIV